MVLEAYKVLALFQVYEVACYKLPQNESYEHIRKFCKRGVQQILTTDSLRKAILFYSRCGSYFLTKLLMIHEDDKRSKYGFH